MRVIFMGTPDFAVPALLKLIESNKYEVVAVYTAPPKPAGRGMKLSFSPVYELAEKYNIKIETPKTLRTDEAVATLKSYNADIAIVAAYGFILPQNVLDIFPKGCINIHPSLLPRHRGAAPIHRTILEGDKETAMCIMKMDAGLDTGDILMMEKFALTGNETYLELHDVMKELGANLLINTLDMLDHIIPTSQILEGASYAQKIDKSEYEIKFEEESGEQIYNKIRAFGAWFNYKDEKLKIKEAGFEKEHHSYVPGTILDNFKIAAKGGFIYPKLLQREGRKVVTLDEFLRGN